METQTILKGRLYANSRQPKQSDLTQSFAYMFVLLHLYFYGIPMCLCIYMCLMCFFFDSFSSVSILVLFQLVFDLTYSRLLLLHTCLFSNDRQKGFGLYGSADKEELRYWKGEIIIKKYSIENVYIHQRKKLKRMKMKISTIF